MDTNAHSRVEISISGRNLPDLDTFSKSDPMCVVWLRDPVTGTYKEVGRTETIDNNLNPDFKTKFVLEYYFEEKQDLLFSMYDIDSASTNLAKHDFMGQYLVSLATIVAAPGQKVTGRLTDKRGNPTRTGTIIIQAEELSDTKDTVNFSVVGEGLKKMDFFGKSDPFLEFYRVREDGTWSAVHTTEVVKNTLSPRWRPFVIPVATLCNNDYNRPILIKCHDWNKRSSPDFIGEFQTTLRELVEAKTTPQFTLLRPKHPVTRKRTKIYGKIIFNRVSVERNASFLDFVKGGMQINLMVAIDFTGSNGHPEDPSSLHYRRGATPNPYQTAITSVGSILMPYDSDGKIPAYGFGAKVGSGVQHCFPLTFTDNPEVDGVEGLMAAYNNAFNYVLLSGPTLFTQVIRTAQAIIESQPWTPSSQNYLILLIITDGVINDMQSTIQAIVDASALPMSIIIVGVGSANFRDMNVLDADDARLSAGGKVQARDTVQFVAMEEFKNHHFSRLAKEVLAEIPAQVVSFAKQFGHRPMGDREALSTVHEHKGPPPLTHMPTLSRMPTLSNMTGPGPAGAPPPMMHMPSMHALHAPGGAPMMQAPPMMRLSTVGGVNVHAGTPAGYHSGFGAAAAHGPPASFPAAAPTFASPTPTTFSSPPFASSPAGFSSPPSSFSSSPGFEPHPSYSTAPPPFDTSSAAPGGPPIMPAQATGPHDAMSPPPTYSQATDDVHPKYL